jgi:hypothetical protein
VVKSGVVVKRSQGEEMNGVRSLFIGKEVVAHEKDCNDHWLILKDKIGKKLIRVTIQRGNASKDEKTKYKIFEESAGMIGIPPLGIWNKVDWSPKTEMARLFREKVQSIYGYKWQVSTVL